MASLSEWDETLDQIISAHESKIKTGKLQLTEFDTKEDLFDHLDKQ